MQKKFLLPLLVFLGAIAPKLALAASTDAEFTTYGNTAMYYAHALNKIALIMSDKNWIGLVFVAAVSIMAISIAKKTLTPKGADLNGIIMAVVTTALGGTLLVSGMVKDKATIHIYDETRGVYEVAGPLPWYLATLITLPNKIETGIIKIIDTSADIGYPGYAAVAGGSDFVVAKALTQIVIGNSHSGIKINSAAYFEDCVGFEIKRPGTTLKPESINSSENILEDVMAPAASPSIYTTWVAPGGGISDEVMTCSAAYLLLKQFYSDPTVFTPYVDQVCSAYTADNSSGAADAAMCRTQIMDNLKRTTGTQKGNAESLLSQVMLSQIFINTYLANDNTTAVLLEGKQAATTSNFGIFSGANEQIPKLRAVIFCIFTAMVPFLLLFVASPMVIKILSGICSFYLFYLMWGVSDALIASMIQPDIIKLFRQAGDIYGHGVSVQALINLPDTNMEVMMMFGQMRATSAILATIIAGMIAPMLNTQAMAMFAGSVAAPSTAAAQQSGKMADNKGVSTEVAANDGSHASAAMYSRRDYDWQAASFQKADMQHGSWLQKSDQARAMMAEGQASNTVDAFRKIGSPFSAVGANGQRIDATPLGNGSAGFGVSNETTGHAVTNNGNKDNKTITDNASNAGVFNASVNKSASKAIQDTAAEVQEKSRVAADSFGITRQATTSTGKDLTRTLSSEEAQQVQEYKQLRTAMSDSHDSSRDAVKALTKDGKYTTDQAEAIVASISGKARVGTPKATEGLFGLDAGVEAGLNIDDRATITEARSTMGSEKFDELVKTSHNEQVAFEKAKQVSTSHRSAEVDSAIDRHGVALAENETSAQNYTATSRAAESVSRSLTEMEQSGSSFNRNLNPEFRAYVDRKAAQDGTDFSTLHASAGGADKIAQYGEGFEDYLKDKVQSALPADAAAVLGFDRKAIQADVGGHIAQAETLPQDPAAAYQEKMEKLRQEIDQKMTTGNKELDAAATGVSPKAYNNAVATLNKNSDVDDTIAATASRLEKAYAADQGNIGGELEGDMANDLRTVAGQVEDAAKSAVDGVKNYLKQD